MHYKLIDTFVIPADMVIGKVSFILHRYLDPEITKRAFVVKMRLVENENFRLVMNDECKLEFSDTELLRPRWWSDRHFGPYSQMLMMDILNNYWLWKKRILCCLSELLQSMDGIWKGRIVFLINRK